MPKLVLCMLNRQQLCSPYNILKDDINRSLTLLVKSGAKIVRPVHLDNDISIQDMDLSVFRNKENTFESNEFFTPFSHYQNKVTDLLYNTTKIEELYTLISDFENLPAVVTINAEMEIYRTVAKDRSTFESLLQDNIARNLDSTHTIQFTFGETKVTFNLLMFRDLSHAKRYAICDFIKILDKAQLSLTRFKETEELGITSIICPSKYKLCTLADIVILNENKALESFFGIQQVHIMEGTDYTPEPLREYILSFIKQLINKAIMVPENEKGVRAAFRGKSGILYTAHNSLTGETKTLHIPKRVNQIIGFLNQDVKPLSQIITEVKQTSYIALYNPSFFVKRPTLELYHKLNNLTTAFDTCIDFSMDDEDVDNTLGNQDWVVV